jgi:hypothetical protein
MPANARTTRTIFQVLCNPAMNTGRPLQACHPAVGVFDHRPSSL